MNTEAAVLQSGLIFYERPHQSPHLPRGTVTTVRYKDDILAQYVHSLLAVMGPDFVFSDDNAEKVKELKVTNTTSCRATITIIQFEPIEHI